MVADGAIGTVRLVQVEYAQDWLTEAPRDGPRQAGGVADRPGASPAPEARSETSGPMRSIWRAFVTGLTLDRACRRPADLCSRDGGSTTTPTSCCATGAERAAYCGPAKWHRAMKERLEAAASTARRAESNGSRRSRNTLWHAAAGPRPPRRLNPRRSPGRPGPAAARLTRIPPGHPEGYLEGFANLYGEAAAAIRARREGPAGAAGGTFPDRRDASPGSPSLMACVRSSKRDGAWGRWKPDPASDSEVGAG